MIHKPNTLTKTLHTKQAKIVLYPNMVARFKNGLWKSHDRNLLFLEAALPGGHFHFLSLWFLLPFNGHGLTRNYMWPLWVSL